MNPTAPAAPAEPPPARGGLSRRDVALSAATTLGGATLVMLATYWSAIFAVYARLDDYIYVYYARTANLDVLAEVWLNAGRPVPALVSTQLLPAIESVDNLGMLRLVGALALTLGAATLGLVVLLVSPGRSSLEHLLAVAVAGVALSTTAAPSAVTWAIMAGQLPSVFFAVSAGAVSVWARTWWHFIICVLLVALATFAYQPTAPVAFFVSAFVTATLWARRLPTSWWRPFLVGVAVVASMAANYAFVVGRGGTALGRISGPTPEARIDWFIGEFVPRTVDLTVPWSLRGAALSALLAAALLLTPLLLGRRFVALPLAVLVSWACAALIVIPGELWASHRLISGAQLIIWVGAAGCLAVAISGLAQRQIVVGVVLTALAAAGAGYSLSVASQRAGDYFAAPNVVDWEATQCSMQTARPVPGKPLFQLNDWGESTSPVLSYDEYGTIASATSFAAPFAIWVALDAVNGQPKPAFDPANVVLAQPLDVTPGAITVDPATCERPRQDADSPAG